MLLKYYSTQHSLCPKEIHLEMPKMKDLCLGWPEAAHSLGNAVM